MVEEEGAGSGARRGGEGFGDGGSADKRERRKKRRVEGEVLGDLEAKMVESFREEDIFDDGFVDVRAGGLDERVKGTSFDMTVTPEIHRRTVPVVTDKLAGTDVDRGEVVVFGGGGNEGERAARRETLKAQRSLRGGRIENAESRHTRDP